MLKNFTPRLYQETILATSVNKNTLVVLPTGMGKCLIHDTPILFSDGSIRLIGDFVESNLNDLNNEIIKNEEHSIAGLKNIIHVPSLNDNLKMENIRISQVHKIKCKEVIRITTQSGSYLTATPEHPILILNNDLKWKRTDRLKIGDFVAVPRSLKGLKIKEDEINLIDLFKDHKKNLSFWIELDRSFAKKHGVNEKICYDTALKKIKKNKHLNKYIKKIFFEGSKCNNQPINNIRKINKQLLYWIGLFLAEGRFHGSVQFFNNDPILLNKFLSISKKVLGVCPNKIEGGLEIRSTALILLLRELFNIKPDQNSFRKELSNQILKRNEKKICSLLKGLFDGDGNVRKKDGIIEYTSASKNLINKICYLLIRMGIRGRVKEVYKRATNSKKSIKKRYYTIRICSKKDLITFYNKINFNSIHKRNNLKDHLSRNKVENTNVDIVPISSIIRNIRNKLKLTSTKYKDFSLPSIDIYERGQRRPSRNILNEMIFGFERKLNEVFELKKDIAWLKKQIKVLDDNFELKDVIKRLKKVQSSLRISVHELRTKYKIYCIPTTREKIRRYLQVLVEEYNNQIKTKEKVDFLNRLINAPLFWDKVKKIENLKEEYVYDISLEKNYNFVAGFNGGIIAHNTAISMLLAVQRFKQYPKSKVLILAPTRPLVEQHIETFKKFLDVPEEQFAVFTGFVKPEKRAELWKTSKIIFSTPQGLENDIITGRINLEDVSLLVFDEAHNAVGNYAYVFVAKQYNKKAKYPRILALTASPGSDLEKIQEVIHNLFIEEVEVRTDNDPDVKPYIKEIQIEWVKVNLPPPLEQIQKFLKAFLKDRMSKLKKWGILQRKNIDFVNKKDLLALQAQLRGRAASGERDFVLWNAISVLAEIMKVQHGLELLETQGVFALHEYLTKLQKEGYASRTKAIKKIVADINFKSALIKTQHMHDKGFQHPKLIELQKIVEKEVKSNKEIKIIIFNQYRDNAQNIVEELNKLENVSAELLIGQQKKGESGLSQKKQKEMLDKFRNNEFNVLCATSVGEQGLDIAQVNLVIFYEPIPSAIRHIQRRGRTGRQEKGRVIILMTKNTRDEGYRWSAHHKEKRMYRHLLNLKSKLTLKHISPQQNLEKFVPEQERIKIFIDHREKGSGVIKELIDMNVNIKLEQLNTADYILSSRCGVELKTSEDFANSIIDGRLLDQIKQLKNNFEKPLVIIEGEQDIFSVRNIHPNAIRGMLATIAISYSIPILFSKNPKESAALLSIIAKREQQETGKDFSMHGDKKPITLKEQQEYIISALPNVGPSLAKELLKKFKTVKKIINAKEDKLKKVKKIGEKKSKDIRDVVESDYLG